MTEAAFTTELLKWARAYGWRVFHVRNAGYRGKSFVQGDKGFPDLILVRGKRWIAAELKVGKAKPRVEQWAWLNALAEVGAEIHTWTPTMWSEILVILSKERA